MTESTTQESDVPVAEGDILLGKYRVERVLGMGGMGVVVAATHIQLRHRVAIKFLLPAALKHPDSVQRFVREARAAVRLKSEHVARVTDVGQLESGAPYMILEYLEGTDLSGVLYETSPLPVNDAIRYVLQACEAIAEAHSAGIVHRDLKPANLFRTKAADGSHTIKVLDFGISKVTEAEGEEAQALTKASTMLGSPLYMSPEAMRAPRSVDARTDQWALGVILYELLTGHRPFLAETITELAFKVMTEPYAPARSLRPELPAALEAVIERALQKMAADRFGNVAELAWALAECGPPEGRASAERASRMLEAAGFRVESPSQLPALAATNSVTGSSTASGPSTLPAKGEGSGDRAPSARSPLMLVGFALFALLLGGAAFVAFRGAPGPAPSGIVAAAPTPPAPSAPSVAPSSSAAGIDVAPAPATDASAPSLPSAAATGSARAQSVKPGAAASAPGPAIAAPAIAMPAPPPSAPKPAQKKNPLDMDLQ